MTDCVVVQPIAACGVVALRKAGLDVHVAPAPDLDQMRVSLAHARAVITRNWGFPAEAIAAAPKLEVIAVHGTGTDRVDHAMAEARGIALCNTPGTNAQSVAEHALGLILSCARAIPASDQAVRSDDFDFRDRHHPVELSGRTLGLVGYGHVAQRLAGMARALGMQVLVLSVHADAAALTQAGCIPVGTVEQICATADVVSLHGVPGRSPRFDATLIGQMKAGAILINTARGALIDDTALVAALRSGHLRAAGLDVFQPEPPDTDSPLLTCPNLYLTPHMGGATVEAMDRTGLAVAQIVIDRLCPDFA
ncbi:hydroxyacid dehydrogenase [Rhodophyticola sp. CCM32]|uniref:hydroxyacid dehydrogenase n=1 Tax=Rhodophyticola sp. CCM32 TaxID=2916397 RepID=UPI00107F2B6F|nr:hydroxyacid dehydrogenase [Rhodophyticola sp. CCM32]QBY01343.1 hydroxyacid dehydrogenase [Rhodophyticola sp. CCM32]